MLNKFNIKMRVKTAGRDSWNKAAITKLEFGFNSRQDPIHKTVL